MSQKYYYYLKHIGDRHVWSETSPCLIIGDWHAWSETQRRPTIHMPAGSNRNYFYTLLYAFIHLFILEKCKYSNKACQSLMGLRLYMLVSYSGMYICRSLIRHVGLRPSISVSYGSPIRHVGLRWVSDETCQVSDGSPIMHVGFR